MNHKSKTSKASKKYWTIIDRSCCSKKACFFYVQFSGCKNVFGKLTQTASCGLAALQTMTFGDKFDQLAEADQQTLRNLPARVFYGVNTDEAIALRLLGVPRGAAQQLAQSLSPAKNLPLPQLRSQLAKTDAQVWTQALGESGQDYFKIWKVLEGMD